MTGFPEGKAKVISGQLEWSVTTGWARLLRTQRILVKTAAQWLWDFRQFFEYHQLISVLFWKKGQDSLLLE